MIYVEIGLGIIDALELSFLFGGFCDWSEAKYCMYVVLANLIHLKKIKK